MTENHSKLNTHSPILPLLVVVVVIGLGYLVIQPTIIELKDLNIQIAAKVKQITTMTEKIDALKYLKAEFAKNTKDLELLGVIIPEDEQVPEILVQLSAIASKSAVQVTSITPKVTSGKSIFQIGVNGDFSGISSFVDNLEKNSRPIAVQSVSFVPSAAKEGTASMTANLSIEIFTLSNAQTNPAAQTTTAESAS